MGCPPLCKDCIVKQHLFTPLHRIQVFHRLCTLTSLTCCRNGLAPFSGTRPCKTLGKQSNWATILGTRVQALNVVPGHLLSFTTTEYIKLMSCSVNVISPLLTVIVSSNSCGGVCFLLPKQTHRPDQRFLFSNPLVFSAFSQNCRFMTFTNLLSHSPMQRVSLLSRLVHQCLLVIAIGL